MGTTAHDASLFFCEYGSVIEQIKRVEPLYADIAAMFHWQPSEIDKLTLDELLHFRELAIERTQQESERGD
ncbi:GpE family phage tail protein [Vibrio sp. 10N.261.46.E11]|uniref:GpE family phage tail protein n=1 Tax=Vibrio sp. 10N.261.46.E11 TaxID=3229662 RepID=UPI003550B2EF